MSTTPSSTWPKRLGATLTVNARNADPVAFLKKEIGGAHGVLVTAVSPKAFEQALGMVRRGGTVSLIGLPPGDFPLPIFDMVLNGITVRGSIVGTRLDLQEALDFAAQGKVKRHRRHATRWRTSTTSSRACRPARSKAASWSTCNDRQTNGGDGIETIDRAARSSLRVTDGKGARCWTSIDGCAVIASALRDAR